MAFLYLIPTGINDPSRPGWGSWAGRYGKMDNAAERPYYFANQEDTWRGKTNRDNVVARWAADFQNDFRARMDWCVEPVSKANHPPRVIVSGERRRKVKSGEVITLDASSSTDPDGNELRFTWEPYPEAGTCKESVKLEGAENPQVNVTVPQLTEPAEIHLILTVRDTGDPPLSRYARVILEVE